MIIDRSVPLPNSKMDIYQPCFYLMVDRIRHKIVVSIRGTASMDDVYTDLDMVPTQITLCGITGKVHPGM